VAVVSGVMRRPRFDLTTSPRTLLFGANTPWNRVRLTRGLGP